MSGHGAFDGDRPIHTGRLGEQLTTAEGTLAAEAVMLNLLATVKAELGDLSRVARFVKVVVFVNSAPHYTEQHVVADGATDLLVRYLRRPHRPAGPVRRRGGRTATRVRRRDRGHRRDGRLKHLRTDRERPGSDRNYRAFPLDTMKRCTGHPVRRRGGPHHPGGRTAFEADERASQPKHGPGQSTIIDQAVGALTTRSAHSDTAFDMLLGAHLKLPGEALHVIPRGPHLGVRRRPGHVGADLP